MFNETYFDFALFFGKFLRPTSMRLQTHGRFGDCT